MLGKLLAPLTTAAPVGVALRDVVIALGAVITLLGILGVLTPDQVERLRRIVEDVSGQWPALVTAAGVIIGAGMSVYRVLTKSSSDRAAAAARSIDAEVPFEQPIRIKTPAGQPDIVIDADGRRVGG